ncbi:nickel/cobalt transporter [Dryocola clanedunensis]
MTAKALNRTLSLSGGMILLVLAALAIITAYQHWSAFIQWCLSVQITLHRYLVLYLLQINNAQYSGGIWLLTGSFIYGVLHAIGPGHGKFIVTTYLSTNNETPFVSRAVPFLGSLMQGLTAIAFVFILSVLLNLSGGDLSQSRWYVEKLSALLIGAFGMFIIWRAVRGYRPAKMQIKSLVPAGQSGHQHDDQCGCGHNHGVGYCGRDGSWMTHLGVIVAIGARPCSGAIMILLFSNALGFITWGIMAVMTMALGTALSIMTLSVAVTWARDGIGKLYLTRSPRHLRMLTLALKVVGGILLILFACVLFLTVIPVSANGDYIAAGC